MAISPGVGTRSVLVGIVAISVAAQSGCTAVFDYTGYIATGEPFENHSFPSGDRYSSRNFAAEEGKIYVTAKPLENRVLWGGPIVPFLPYFLFPSEETPITPEKNRVFLQFNITAEAPVRVVWDKLSVSTIGGEELKGQPTDIFFRIMALYKKEWDDFAVLCSLDGLDEPFPNLVVELPLIHVGDEFFRVSPIVLELEGGRHFAIGFK